MGRLGVAKSLITTGSVVIKVLDGAVGGAKSLITTGVCSNQGFGWGGWGCQKLNYYGGL